MGDEVDGVVDVDVSKTTPSAIVTEDAEGGSVDSGASVGSAVGSMDGTGMLDEHSLLMIKEKVVFGSYMISVFSHALAPTHSTETDDAPLGTRVELAQACSPSQRSVQG